MTVEIWPRRHLTAISFRQPWKRLQWPALNESFRRDAEHYLAMRAKPDLFDERANAPTRALAPSTLRLQRDHIRLAASVLTEEGKVVERLSDLIEPDHFRMILRHYLDRADGAPNAFVTCMAATLIGIARYAANVSADQVAALKRIARRLPPVPLDLTAKNKSLLRQLESDRLRAKLLFLPEDLLRSVARDLDGGRLRFVDAQVAVATDILLAVPLRAQNLTRLHWQRHFNEPSGPNGRLMLHIPATETKSKKRDIIAEVPADVAQRLRWYRRKIFPRLHADPNGFLFVAKGGRLKTQDTFSDQIISTISKRVGIAMTPHQFRHFSATWYLAANPAGFETVRQALGHGWIRTTGVYGGVCSQRAIGAYQRVLFEQREGMKLKRPQRKKRTSQ